MKVLYRRVLVVVFVFCLLAAVAANGARGAAKTTDTSTYSNCPLVEKVKGGEIDWGNEMYYAIGEGAMPSPKEESNRARAYLKAKGYARMQAIANLLMAVEGTAISYEAYGKDYIAQSESLKQKIEGYLRGVEIIKDWKTTVEGCTVVKVVVGTKMYGKTCPGSALLEELVKESNTPVSEPVLAKPEPEPAKPVNIAPEPTKVEPEPAPVAKIEPTSVKIEIPKIPPKPTPVPKETPSPAKEPMVTVTTQVTTTSEGTYTSVIVDTLGYKVARAMSPKIRTKTGDEVWGTLKMSPDEVQNSGPVAYARSMSDAKKHTRTGSSPLVVRAIGRAGGSRMCDVVLSDEDVEKLKSADRTSNPSFLAEMHVVFIVDPIKVF